MSPDDLSPADRELAQEKLLQIYLQRKGLDRRADWERAHDVQARKTQG